VLARNLAKSSYPRKGRATKRTTTATASLRMQGGAVGNAVDTGKRSFRTFNRGGK
jgi:hypothetical protein